MQKQAEVAASAKGIYKIDIYSTFVNFNFNIKEFMLEVNIEEYKHHLAKHL